MQAFGSLTTPYFQKKILHPIQTNLLRKLNSEEIVDPPLKYEFFKYKIRKIVIKFSKCLAKEIRKSKTDLEAKLKLLESSLDNDACVFKCNQCKKQLEKIFQSISEGIRVRSRCQWYEKSEKSTKYFSNQEKKLYVFFWDEIKSFSLILPVSFRKKKLSISQRQTIVKLIEKREK